MKKTSLLLFVIVVLLGQKMAAVNYYVSKSGNNSNAGTSTNAAFLTISKAASVMNAGDTCFILGGIYRETVVPAHSGTPALPITFTAYPGETPIVSGADLLSVSWSVYTNSIYKATTGSSFRQLFVDGAMMNEARWPNAGVNNLLNAPRSTPTTCTYTNLTDNALSTNINLLGAALHIFPNEFNNAGYAANTRTITGWNPATKGISWTGDIFNTGATATYYYLYGTLPLLDIPTEWCLTGGTVYLWTPDGASPATHTVEIKSRANAFTLDTRSNIVVRAINVFGAAISMVNTVTCTVDGCNVEYVQHLTTADWKVNVAIANLVSGKGSKWINSTIAYSSQDGIRCMGQNEMVSNCVIQNVAYYPGSYYASVTAFSGGSGTEIVNNTFTYSGRYLVGASAPNVNIAYNDLGYATMLTGDGGATYEYVGNDDGQGTTIHHNWTHHSWAGVYLDAYQTNYFIYRNVCFSNFIGMVFNQFTNNLIINNTSVSNSSKDILLNGPDDSVSLINNLWRVTQIAHNPGLTEIDNGWFPPVGADYVPQAGSGAIDQGTVFSPYTDGYVGAAPDIGAYEVGDTYWTPGANFALVPFPNFFARPAITNQPLDQTNYATQTVTFSVGASSILAVQYQWQAGAVGSGVYTNLIAGGQFSSVTNDTLIISNLTLGNAADYVVAVINTNGATLSLPATLTVLDPSPYITVQPKSRTNIISQTVGFTSVGSGFLTLNYQWQAGAIGSGIYTNLVGPQFSGVTGTNLTISSIGLGNAADYVMVVTSVYGSATSAVATLTVLSNATYLSTILADHPVSYWPLNEMGGSLIHDIVGNNNGTAMNTNFLWFGSPGVLYSNGVPSDTAIYFTNSGSAHIKVPYSASLNTPKFSVEVWLKMPIFPARGAGADMNPLSFDDSNPKGWALEIPSPNLANPNMYAWLGNGTWTTVVAGTCIQGKWSHYALTYDGTNFACYTNGVLAGSTNSGYTLVSPTHSLYMGAYDSAGSVSRFYQGAMAKVAFYSNALPANRIQAHYQVGTNLTSVASPMVSVHASGPNIIVDWTWGTLQQAPNVAGPWTDVSNAVPPYAIGTSNSTLFFRAKF